MNGKALVKRERETGWNPIIRQFLIGMSVFMVMALVPVAALAHSLFIQSGRYLVHNGQESPLFFCYGHYVPVADAVRREKLSFVRVFDPAGARFDVELRDGKSLHSYVITYDKPGTYVLAAETNPGYFGMYIDKQGKKRHSLKPLSGYIEKAASILSSMRSSQWAKTYVVCEKPSEAFPARVGLLLELVPEKDLTCLQKGDRITFTVYFDGKPYTGDGFWDVTYNGFSTESEDMYLQQTAVSGGVFSVPIDESGRWFVRFFTKVPAAEKDRNRYLVDKRTATITFEVRNKRKRPKIKRN